MGIINDGINDYVRGVAGAWDRFWFTPSSVRLLCLLRIAVGAMLLYTHAVWTLGLNTFAAPDGLVPSEFVRAEAGPFAWSHLLWIESPGLLWACHVLALIVFFAFMIGFQTRISAVLSLLLTVAYANRLPVTQFGLDQLNTFLTMYLAIGPCGAMYSLDAWLKRGRAGGIAQPFLREGRRSRGGPLHSTAANIAIRLIQIHMCVIYLFAGIGKVRGDSWVGGDALWGAFASYEYQTLDMTWTAHAFWIINLLTFGTIIWELGYPALVWCRWSRPWVLLTAVAIHLGIGICMGMMTFGLIMIVGNAAFLNDYFQQWRLKQERCADSQTSGQLTTS